MANSNSASRLEGHRLFVAAILPTDSNDEFDEQAYRRLIRYFLSSAEFTKSGGLIANAEAGDVFYLTREEKRRILEVAIDEVAGRIPVFAGTFALSTKESVSTAIDAKRAGATGIFVLPPGGAGDVTRAWLPTMYPEVWIDQIHAQNEAVNLPILTHPTSSVTPQFGGGIPSLAVEEICRSIPNIVGWKMTYNYDGYRRVTRTLRRQTPHVAVMGANAQFFHENYASGEIDGTVTGSWNYAFEPMMAHRLAWLSEDIREARRIWDSGLAELQEYIYSEHGRLHVRYKVATWLRGFCQTPRMIPPMPAPQSKEIDKLQSLLRNLSLSTIDTKLIDEWR